MKFKKVVLFLVVTVSVMLTSLASGAIDKSVTGADSMAEKKEVGTINGSLDGLTFSGQTGGVSSVVENETDQLFFSNGRLRSLRCDNLGFSSGIYATSKKADKTFFIAEIYSTTHGKIIWKGSVQNSTIEATFEWVKEGIFGKSEKNYWFKGDQDS